MNCLQKRRNQNQKKETASNNREKKKINLAFKMLKSPFSTLISMTIRLKEKEKGITPGSIFTPITMFNN
jgi:hypothetical protein